MASEFSREIAQFCCRALLHHPQPPAEQRVPALSSRRAGKEGEVAAFRFPDDLRRLCRQYLHPVHHIVELIAVHIREGNLRASPKLRKLSEMSRVIVPADDHGIQVCGPGIPAGCSAQPRIAPVFHHRQFQRECRDAEYADIAFPVKNHRRHGHLRVCPVGGDIRWTAVFFLPVSWARRYGSLHHVRCLLCCQRGSSAVQQIPPGQQKCA